ncbi:MAG: hypothetical protein AUH86_23190 [Acidobacteria bacterium 13_1_40CM_4_58_4]|nr:MAG: hypothetical protein AUH86_23190 [Acidobacteria bacterium 13_1_40CM_4_58_4]
MEGCASGREKTPIPPLWFRYFVPSVADLIFIVLFGAVTWGALAPRLLGDAGIGWHIRNGEQMLRMHAITRIDSFSFTMSGRPWYAWEWLYDVVIAGVHDRLGLNGVVFFTALAIAATFALTLRLAVRRGAVLPVTVILLALSISASTIHFFARPHVLSWLFAAMWFQLLDSSEISSSRETDRRVLWLPVLMLLWVNLHGGFLLGFALLGLYLIAGLIRHSGSREGPKDATRQRLKHLGTVTVLSLLASLINPYSYKLHLHVYQYLSNRWLMNHIDEFLSPNFHGVAQQCFAALLLIAIVALAIAPKKPQLSQLFVIIFAAYSGLYAARNLPVSSILLTLIVAPLLSQVVVGAHTNPQLPPRLRAFFSRCESFTSRMGGMELRFRGHLWPVAAVMLGLLVCLQHGKLGSRQLMDARFDAKRFPVQAAEVIARRGIDQPIFTPDSWGGYLIYRLYPQTKVFVDDRHDLYGEQFLKDYLKVIRVAPDWDKVLNEMHVDWVLVPAGSSLANMLRETSQWTVIHEDGTEVLFQRTKVL